MSPVVDLIDDISHRLLALLTVILSGDFRSPFGTFEVALDSSHEALSSYTVLGGCGCNSDFSGPCFVVIVAQKLEGMDLELEIQLGFSVGFNLVSVVAYMHLFTPIFRSQLHLYLVASYLAALCFVIAVRFLPGCEGERQYHTLISVLRSVSPHAPSGVDFFLALLLSQRGLWSNGVLTFGRRARTYSSASTINCAIRATVRQWYPWPRDRRSSGQEVFFQECRILGSRGGDGWDTASRGPTTIVTPKSQFRTCPSDHVKRLATSPHDPLGITDSACKNHLVVVSVQYGPFNTYISIRSTTIGKSRVARDPIVMHTSWRSNSNIASVTSIVYPRMKASGESSTTKHRLLHASGPHPIPPPNDPKTNQYNQDLGLIHSTNGNHLESPNEGSSIDHQVTIHLHAQNITIFPTNETWYFTSEMLVSSSGGLILILTAQSTRNEFRMHSDY
ncbi:hypothetical protein F511_30726 [Dorcoceras hygrometricum]|uniref:Uncharacterized protein n=1 Tax=Dorcoceras hygrometricum TaxID=472368 RepID=A0A2Z7B0S6_9LAMI|nr:hypothetical protein F511_30726 [Dorcoceras hygrometricum]